MEAVRPVGGVAGIQARVSGALDSVAMGWSEWKDLRCGFR